MFKRKPILLQVNSVMKNDDIEKEEKYYSEKLGRKVVILKSNVAILKS